MKKTLLLSAALMGSMCMFAQDQGTDITPANYYFNNCREIPWYSTLTTNANIPAPVWSQNPGLSAEWNNGLIAIASAGQAEGNFQAMLDATSLIDLGGDVGVVFCFAGNKSNIKEKLAELYPDGDYSNMAVQGDGGVAGWNYNFFTDPENTPTVSEGYIHFKMVLNVYQPDNKTGAVVFQNLYQVDNQGNNNTTVGEEKTNEANTPGTGIDSSEFVKRYEDDNEPELDDDDNMIWDPTQWLVYEYDFNVPDPDEDGKIATPARIKFQTIAGGDMKNYALFIKELSFTWRTGEPQIVGERLKTYVTLNPDPKGDVTELPAVDSGAVNSISTDLNAPVEYFNLQGVKVANPENGIFIRKQGKKTSKVIIR